MLGSVRFFFVIMAVGFCVSAAQTVSQPQESEARRRPPAIPDPVDKLGLAVLAANPTVATELGLSTEKLELLKKALRESNGNLKGILVFPNGKLPAKEELMTTLQKIRQKNEELVEELFPPNTWERLRQIAFQIEVSRLGYGESLANGRLGMYVGVHDNQKEHLRTVAMRIEAKAALEIAAILERTQKEMLNELSAEQRTKAEKSLGKPFYFRDDEFRAASRTRY